MTRGIPGLHHVTAIAGDPQRNLDFYTGVLGLRLVKLTVNYDDPETYHLYYGNGVGEPGTILTFFVWPGPAVGRTGTGQISVIAFAAPAGSLGFWAERFRERNVVFEPAQRRFGEEALAFQDPDGLQLKLVATAGGSVPGGGGLRGLHSVTLSEDGHQRTEKLLTAILGFRAAGQESNHFRYTTEGGGSGSIVELACVPDRASGHIGAGTVHHVAWRACADSEQAAWRREVAAAGLNVTPVMDRKYFRSIYFREPGGVLFEIATDGPGFAIDEAIDRLGTRLSLPEWLEPRREYLELRLPTLRVTEIAKGA